MSVKTASTKVVVRDGIAKRQVTEKEARNKLFWQVVQTIAWGFIVAVDTSNLQRMVHLLLLIMSGIQVANYIDQLRRVRRGEIVEVTVRTTRTNASRRTSIVVAAVVTIIVTLATTLIFHVISGSAGFAITATLILAVLWIPLLAIWYRILAVSSRQDVGGLSAQSNAIAIQAPQAPAIPAAGAGPAHWWTQNAVRDDVQVQVVGGASQSGDH